MRGLGVIEDGFTFAEAEIRRASPRFWWGQRKRAAYARVLARRGIASRDRSEESGSDSGAVSGDSRDRVAAGAVAGATVAMAETSSEKRGDGGGSSFSGSADGGGVSSDGGTSSSSSSSSSSSDGGGGSGE